MTVGERIKAIRKSKHMTQRELADKIGVQRAVVHKYKKNLVSISVKKMNDIANIFRVDICYFFGKEEKHGKWEQADDTKCRCSSCKKVFLIAVYPNGGDKNYCPNCGARMDLEE